MPAEESKPSDSEASGKRKGAMKTANQLVTNLFHGGRRFYMLAANTSQGKTLSEEGPRMYYLLD
jgi:hypothetical protein